MKPEFKLAKKLPGKSQIERVRAARAMIEARNNREVFILEGFLDIFHPELSHGQRREIISMRKSCS